MTRTQVLITWVIFVLRGNLKMIKGRKVYDPLTNTWSTGWWIPMYDQFGRVLKYLPVWRD